MAAPKLTRTIVGLLVAGLAFSASAAGKNFIRGIDVEGVGEDRTIRIRTASQPTFTVFRLSNPMRVVVDISGGDLSSIESPISVEDGVIGQVGVRQFNADGFLVGRVIVGFEQELSYNVQAEGDSVVVKTGALHGEQVGRAIPPPIAPVDRAAAERFVSAKREAQAAARIANQERRDAEAAAEQAHEQQAEAQRMKQQAKAAKAAAEAARAEAETLRKKAEASLASNQAQDRELARKAEEKRRELQREAARIAEERAKAERLALQAEQRSQDAKNRAAQAEALHKRREAELQQKIARSKLEEDAAKAAIAQAEKAQREAEAATLRAQQAKRQSETAKQELASKLARIDRTAKEAKAERERLEREQRALARKKATLEEEKRHLAQKADEVDQKRRTLASERQQIKSERERLAREKAALAAAKGKVNSKARAVKRAASAVENEKGDLSKREARLQAAEQRLQNESTTVAKRTARKKQDAIATAALVNPAPAPKVANASRHFFRGVSRAGSGDDAGVLLAIPGLPDYTAELIDSPPRLVIDITNTKRKTRRTTFGIRSPFVRKVRMGDHGDHLRAVLDLTADNLAHKITKTESGLLVSLEAKQAFEPAIAEAPTPKIADLRFEGGVDMARIVIDTAGDFVTDIDRRSSKAWVLELKGANLPKKLERSLDTSAYGSVVRLVSAYQSSGDSVKVVANLTGPATGELKKASNRLVWEIIPDSKTPTAVATTASTQAAGFASEAQALARSTPTQRRLQSKRRVNINLKDAEIVNVLRLLSEVSGENIITSDDVKGNITLNLRNVPWDVALDTILKTKGYDMVRANNILRIAPAKVIQEEQEAALIKKQNEAAVEELKITVITVNYATASEISGQLKAILTDRGSVQVDDRTNTIIVEDVVSNHPKLIQLTKRLDKQTPQVLIEARIVEASSNFLEQMGIQWGGTGQANAKNGNATGLIFPGDVTVSGASDDASAPLTGGVSDPGRYAVNLPAPIGAGAGGGVGFIFGSAGGSQLLNLRLSALEESGSGRIISSPRITTLDNRKATISQGVDIPVSVVSAAGVNTRFIPARLTLEVTPHVTNDGSVLMKLKTSKNEPDFSRVGASGDPTVVNKEAETEVLVQDGDTAVIGGIYTRTKSEVVSAVPFLSKIPVLGWLFRSRRIEDQRSELLIFVTPRIVNREAALMQTGNIEE